MAVIDEDGVRRRLRIMLGSDKLVDEYVAKFGFRIDIQKVNALREPAASACNVAVPGETAADDPIFLIFLKCPSCYLTKIPCFELKAKSLQIVQDKFLMPHYRATSHFPLVDYNLLSVTVCPQCLFASPDKKDFITRDPARNREIPSRLHQGELAAILAAADDRANWLTSQSLDATRDLLLRDRTPAAGLAAYELAVQRAMIETQRSVPFSLFRTAGYRMKQATIAKVHGLGETPWLEKALETYLQCFEKSNAPGFQYEGQILYLIILLGIRLGQLDVSGSYISVLDRTKSRVEASGTEAAISQQFDRWYNLARAVWSDREDEALFDLPRG